MQLTPNRRLAAYLMEQGEEACSFSDWIEKLWGDYAANTALLLNPIAQQILWERVIQDAREVYPLLNVAPTAKMVMEAWVLCHQWEIPLDTLEPQTEDQDLFLKWAEQFREICQTNQWIDSSRLIPILSLALQKAKLPLPPTIHCVGFQEWTPQQTRLLTFCRNQGIKVEERSLLKQKGEAFQLAASSIEEELSFALLYAESVLAEKPDAQLGIVVPDLEQRRFEVLQHLEDHFKSDQYNVSAPLSLADYPLIDAALLGLRLLEKDLSFEEWSRFLRLPFFGNSASEMAYRAQLDVLFREAPRPQTCSIGEFSSILSSLISKLPAFTDLQLMEGLTDLLHFKPITRRSQSADQWAALFIEMLNKLKWPGERSLNSLEYQLKSQWYEVLGDYRDLSHILGKHRYSEALYEVQRLCRLKKFLPPSEKAPIQVLGLLEALGLPFDHLWVVGFHRDAWPKEPAPNPFIPLSLQQTLNLPRSSPRRELQVAAQITEQLSRGAAKVVFSYPQKIQDNKTTISPLLTSLPLLPFQKPTVFSPRLIQPQMLLDLTGRAESSEERPIESSIGFVDFKEPAPPLQLNENPRQGAYLLKLQSVCPFRAFAEIRLKARPIGTEQWGLNPAERGEILHQILHVFWQTLASQADLIALGHRGCEERLQLAVETVFKRWQKDHRYRLQPRYFSLERQRAVRLIRQFIQLELSRPPFKVIAHEVEQSIILNGIPLTLRIDRIDQLETGEEILIDYKTGKIHIADWFGERPLDPQLPLYCVTRNPRPKGIVFALLQSSAVQYQGLSANQGALPGILPAKQLMQYGSAESWDEQLDWWQEQLEALAYEFMVGRADVAPLEGEKTCRSCHLKPLCRFNSIALSS